MYFADGFTNPITDEAVDHLDLRYAFDEVPMNGSLSTRTPSGSQGMIMADRVRLGELDLAYRPDSQEWRKCPGNESIYVGYWKKAAPTPSDLARDKQLPGEEVELADGAKWLIPRLRFWGGDSGYQVALPTRVDLDESGQWTVGGVVPQYAEIDKVAARMFEGMVSAKVGSGLPLTVAEALDIVAALLSVNYAVSKIELVMIGALSTNCGLEEACRVAMDYETAEQWAQKKTTGDA